MDKSSTTIKLPQEEFELPADADQRFIAEYGICAQDHRYPIPPPPAPRPVSASNIPRALSATPNPPLPTSPNLLNSEKGRNASVKPCWHLWTECGRNPTTSY
jgi:hypothetical protein